MPRPIALRRPQSVCQICNSIVARRLHSMKPAPSAHNVARPQLRMAQFVVGGKTSQRRLLASEVIPIGKPILKSGNTRNTLGEHDSAIRPTPKKTREELFSITNMMTYLDKSKLKVLSNKRIPPEKDVVAALQACRVVANYIMDDTVQPQITHIANEADSSASELLSLDSASNQKSTPSDDTAASIMVEVKHIIDKISDTAYAVVAHPPVFITPEILQLYVEVQARLGKPETLPQVFQMYASKPMPRETAGSVSYAKQNPNKVANAIEAGLIEKALDTAIQAKNLDAAVGIVDNGYATKAYVRNKILRKAVLPIGTFAATPLAAYALATNYSHLQDSMDSATATNVAFAGILAYVGFTASIGVVAITTANDQMNRVTWAPGVPLRLRWLREEERAALDKIACAWGFREKWRQGEEEGADWEALREYIGQKDMILDKADLMEGMDY